MPAIGGLLLQAAHENLTEALETHLDVRDGETTQDQKYTLESVACLGCCSLAPVIMIDEDTFGRLTPEEARRVVRDYGAGSDDSAVA